MLFLFSISTAKAKAPACSFRTDASVFLSLRSWQRNKISVVCGEEWGCWCHVGAVVVLYTRYCIQHVRVVLVVALCDVAAIQYSSLPAMAAFQLGRNGDAGGVARGS